MAAGDVLGKRGRAVVHHQIPNRPRSRLCASRLARQVSSMLGWLRCGIMTDTEGLPDFTLKILRPSRTRRGGMWPANTAFPGHRSLIVGYVVKPSVQRLSGDECPCQVMVFCLVGA